MNLKITIEKRFDLKALLKENDEMLEKLMYS